MQFKNSALIATVALSTFTEASPARFHLNARENETREPKNGQKTAAAGVVSAIAGLAGIAAPYLFHTASVEGSEISNVTNSTTATTTLSPKLTPVSLSTRDPKNGQKTAAAGVAAAIAGLAGIAAPYLFHTASVEGSGTTNTTNWTTSLSPKITPVALATREPAGRLAGTAAGVGAIGAIAGALLPFLFPKKGPSTTKSIETNETVSANSTWASPKLTPVALESREPKGRLAGTAAAVGGLSAIVGAILPFVAAKKGSNSARAIESEFTKSASTSPLVTRDAAFEISAFRDNVSIASAITLPTPAIGSSVTLALDCGNIVVTLRQLEAFTCNFNLPSDMSSGTLTGENPGQALSFEVSGDCVGVEFTATNNCADCIAPLNVDCQGTVDGTDNDVELCATGTTLAEC